jgi:hypothetical protein
LCCAIAHELVVASGDDFLRIDTSPGHRLTEVTPLTEKRDNPSNYWKLKIKLRRHASS